MTDVRLIVGLGNPTSQYANTFHNVGFLAVDAMLKEIGGDCTKKECSALTLHARIDGAKVIIAKPQTYMNLSGTAVRELCNKYKIDTQNVLVVYDDIDLPAGSLRFRTKGSGGTHNGMRDIVLKIGEDFPRLRVGIGRPQPGRDLASYVLSRIDSGENGSSVRQAIERAGFAAIDFAAGDSADRIGAKYNSAKG